jgi:hypothetical protein
VQALPRSTAKAHLTTGALGAILIPTVPAQGVHKGRITFTHADNAGTGGGQ